MVKLPAEPFAPSAKTEILSPWVTANDMDSSAPTPPFSLHPS